MLSSAAYTAPQRGLFNARGWFVLARGMQSHHGCKPLYSGARVHRGPLSAQGASAAIAWKPFDVLAASRPIIHTTTAIRDCPYTSFTLHHKECARSLRIPAYPGVALKLGTLLRHESDFKRIYTTPFCRHVHLFCKWIKQHLNSSCETRLQVLSQCLRKGSIFGE